MNIKDANQRAIFAMADLQFKINLLLDRAERLEAKVKKLRDALALVLAGMEDATGGGSCPGCYNTEIAEGHCNKEPCSWDEGIEAARSALKE